MKNELKEQKELVQKLKRAIKEKEKAIEKTQNESFYVDQTCLFYFDADYKKFLHDKFDSGDSLFSTFLGALHVYKNEFQDKQQEQQKSAERQREAATN